MADSTLLSDLCSICNTTTSKYRCPGCDARTCSLPCYKRHQQWAQCTGKRDPTKFKKKSLLATPAGIDHDFNFLTSIERGAERAEREVQDRGLSVATEVRTGPRKGEVSDRQLQDAGVTVLRAPKGLTRQRQNKTHRSVKKGNIVWTVEWINGPGEPLLSEVSEVTPIDEAYRYAIGQPLQKANRKRKRSIRGQDTAPAVEDLNQESQLSDTGRAPGGVPQPSASEPSGSTGPEPDADVHVASLVRPSDDVDQSGTEPVPPEYRFFLLRPRTTSSRHVLIPIDGTSTLQESLSGRQVLEFPTMYVFSGASAENLPDDCMLEAEYLDRESGGRNNIESIINKASVKTDQSSIGKDGFEGIEELDSQKILEVLQQDLGT